MFYNQALEPGIAPNQWRISNIIRVTKNGDLSNDNNIYRGMPLTSLVAKTLSRMILNWILTKMEKKLRDNQNVIREKRSTTSYILMLRKILEEAEAKNVPALMGFIDFAKAFDSLERPSLVKILQAIPRKCWA